MPIYVSKQTGWFDRISDTPLSDPNLVEVPSMPPGVNYQYSDKNGWSEISQAEIGNSQIDLNDVLSNSVVLKNLPDLRIGNNHADKKNLDILYYKDVVPKLKNDGIYISSKGYLIFPQLAFSSTEEKIVSFVFYCGNDSRYIAFGISRHAYPFNSNDYNKCEIALRFRNQKGCYYQHGRYISDRNSLSYMGYQGYDRGYYYRLDIPTGSQDRIASFYKLNGGEPNQWFGGILKQEIPLTLAPDRGGTLLYPHMGEYNGSLSPLIGVSVRNR